MSFPWKSQDYDLGCIKQLKNWWKQFNALTTQKKRVLEDSFQALTCLACLFQYINAHFQSGEQKALWGIRELRILRSCSKTPPYIYIHLFFFTHFSHLLAAHWLLCGIWERTLTSPNNFHFKAKRSFQDTCPGYNLACRNLCWNWSSLWFIAPTVNRIDSGICRHMRTVAPLSSKEQRMGGFSCSYRCPGSKTCAVRKYFILNIFSWHGSIHNLP